MSKAASQKIATFRDPAGSLQIQGDEVVRTVRPDYACDVAKFLTSATAERWIREGCMVETRIVSMEA